MSALLIENMSFTVGLALSCRENPFLAEITPPIKVGIDDALLFIDNVYWVQLNLMALARLAAYSYL